jgi:hypothetical protein
MLNELMQTRIAELVVAIHETEYYTNLFERVCGPATYHLHTNPNAISLLNDFWFALPDGKVIRTPVFFQLCNIIEDAGEVDDDYYDDSAPF